MISVKTSLVSASQDITNAFSRKYTFIRSPNKVKLYLLLLLGFQLVIGQSQNSSKIDFKNLKYIGNIDPRFQSYNIEMCEVIGGDFWIPYHLIDSVRKTTNKKGFDALKWKIEPINLYEKKLRNLAAALSPSYVRVSGTWANAIYFQDNNDAPLSSPPAGFKNILTRAEWKGVIDFCKSVDGKLVTSFPISAGIRDKENNWSPHSMKSIMDYTASIGGEIAAAEMFNEPSHASHGDAPKGYNGETYAKDFAVFKDIVKKEYPHMKILGPGSTGEGGIIPSQDIPVDKILAASPKPVFDVFTYHYYGTVSQRCMGGQKPANALSAEWLSKTEKGLAFYQDMRDTYMPNVPIWNTESAETACGGNPWAATYIDCFRYLEQLGRLAKKGVQVVMHNTLARSEYGLLDHDTHNPRPNYWAALLWSKLMGTEVYQADSLSTGVDVFVHNQKGNRKGRTALILNTIEKETTVAIPTNAIQYLLTADELITKKVKLNGKELQLTAKDEVPELVGKKVKAGGIVLPAHSIMFLTFGES